MILQDQGLMAVYLACALVTAGVMILAWRRSDVFGARPYAWVAAGHLLWILGYLFRLNSPDVQHMLLWDTLQGLGALLWPLAYLAFVLEYSGQRLRHPRRTWAILAAVPLAFLTLAAVESWRGSLTRPAAPAPAGEFQPLPYGATAWVWATAAYTYGIGLVGLFFLIAAYRRARPLARAQIRTVFLGALVPILGITLSYLGVLRDMQIDLACVAFALGDLIVVWGLFRHRLPDLVPLARDRVFEGLLDGVVVLDTELRIADYNREAGVLLGQPGPAALDPSAAGLLPTLLAAVARHEAGEEVGEIGIVTPEGQRFFDLGLSPLRDWRDHLAGHLIVLRDITARKHAQEALQQANAELESRVEERTSALALANANLTAEIAERQRAQEAQRQLLEAATRARQTLQALAEAAQAVQRAPTPAAILATVGEEVSRLGRQVIIFTLAAGDGPLEVAYTAPDSAPMRDITAWLKAAAASERPGAADSLGVGALGARQAIFCDLAPAGDAAGAGLPDLVGLLLQRMANELGQPRSIHAALWSGGAPAGLLTVVGADLTEAETPAITSFANQVSIALENARLREAVQRHADDLERRVAQRTRQLTTLYRLAGVNNDAPDVQATLARSLAHVLEALPAGGGAIHLLDETGASLQLMASRGVPGELAEQIRSSPSDTGWLAALLRESQPQMIATLDSRLPIDLRPYAPFVGAPIRAGGETLGVLSATGAWRQPPSAEDVALLAAAADHIGVAVQTATLRRQAERLAILEERERLARELHDAVTQSLYSLTLFVDGARELARRGQFAQIDRYLQDIEATAGQTLKEMRLLLHELRPAVLGREGLVSALQSRLAAVEARAGIRTQLQAEPLAPLAPAVEEALYRIAQEALNNSLKHARATEVSVRLWPAAEKIALEIADNGRGFDPEAALRQGGMGVANMRARAEQLGGTTEILAQPGLGTIVRVTVPAARAEMTRIRPTGSRKGDVT